MTRLRAHRRQGGFTLPELLIGIVLASIFGLALLAFYSSSLTSARTSENQSRAQTEGREALGRLSSELRQSISPDGGISAPVQSMTATSIIFFHDPTRDPADLTPLPYRVRYQVVNGELLRDVANPVGAAPPYSYGTYGPQLVLATGVQTADPLFTGKAVDGTSLGSTLSGTATKALAQIQLRLVLGYRNGQTNSTLELTTDVVPRNPRTD